MQGLLKQDKMITCDIKVELKNPKTVLKALKPDVEKTERFEVELKALQKHLNLKIKAKDLTAMQAALNSYLRLINTIKEVDHD